MKKCSKCKQEKSLNEYNKDSSRKDGTSTVCKPCRKIISNKWFSENKEEYYAKRKGKYNEYYKERYAFLSPQQRQEQREYLREWEQNNKDKVNGYKRKQRQKTQFKLKENIRTRMYQYLKGKKDESMEYLLGCDIEFYKKYLEKQFTPQMTWDNYGIYWEIDHIKMLSTFDLENLVERKEAFTFTNTRPLPIKENRQRKN